MGSRSRHRICTSKSTNVISRNHTKPDFRNRAGLRGTIPEQDLTAKISGRNLIPVGRLTPFSQHDYEAISIAGHGPSRGARDSAETGPRVAFTSGAI